MGKLANPAVGRQLKMVADKIRALNNTGEPQWITLHGHRAKLTEYKMDYQKPYEQGFLCSMDGRYYLAIIRDYYSSSDKDSAELLHRGSSTWVHKYWAKRTFKIHALAEIYKR